MQIKIKIKQQIKCFFYFCLIWKLKYFSYKKCAMSSASAPCGLCFASMAEFTGKKQQDNGIKVLYCHKQKAIIKVTFKISFQ